MQSPVCISQEEHVEGQFTQSWPGGKLYCVPVAQATQDMPIPDGFIPNVQLVQMPAVLVSQDSEAVVCKKMKMSQMYF